MTEKHHHKAHKHKEHEEDMSDIEDSLFSDAGDDEPEVGLIKKSHKSHSHASHSHGGHSHRRELKLSIPVPDKDVMVKAGIILIIAVLLFFFFYNPFYCKMSWNQDQCSIVDDEVEEEEEEVEIAEEVDVTVGDEEEESDVEESDVEELGDNESDVEEDLDIIDGDADVDGDVVDLSGDLTFDFTKLPDISAKAWGWQVDKVYFSVDNQKENFIPKVRVRVYEGSEKGTNMRSDVVKVFPELDVGKKLISSIEMIAMIGDLDTDSIVVMELKDEGDEKGLAEDRLMVKVKKTINHPIS